MKTSLVVLCCVLLTFCAREGREETATAESMTVVATDTPAVSTEAPPEPNRVSVRLLEYRIEMPTELNAGTTTFDIRNDGKRKHNFEIEGEGLELELPEVLGPGASSSLTVELKPGKYKIYCPVGDHEKKHGMVTWLTVT